MAWSISIRPALFALVSILVWSCTEEKVKTNVSVTVKTNKGDPVSDAIVILGKPGVSDVFAGKKLGETNNLGLFSSELLLDPDRKVAFNVVKQSDTYYFAPHTEVVAIAKAGQQDVLIEATLYFVPKPSPDETTIAESATTEEMPLESAGVGSETSEIVAAPSAPQEIVVAEPGPVAEDVDAAEEVVGESSDEQVAEAPPMELKLSSVEQGPASLPSEEYPKPDRKNDGGLVFTVHTYSDGEPVSDVEIHLGQEQKGDLKTACTSNERGRCVIRFAVEPEGPAAFVARKTGYRTQTLSKAITDKGSLRIDLIAGHTVDMFAITKTYNFTRGLAGVRISVNGKQVGITDKYGHYAHVYTGRKDDLLTVTMASAGFLPEEFETDFVASGEMTLTRYFSPRSPPPVKMTLLEAVPAGKVSPEQAALFSGAIDRLVRRSALKHIYSSTAFEEYPLASFNREARRNGETPTELLNAGWQNTDMKAVVDALLKPTIVLGGDKATLELSAIDSNGKVLAAAKESLDGLEDEGAIDRTLKVLSAKLIGVFPFEGAVVSKGADSLNINIGFESGRGIRKGDLLDVYGVQTDKLGRNQTHKKIGSLRVRDVGSTTSEAVIEKMAARAVANRGDLVVLRGRTAPQQSQAKLQVRSSGGKGLARANVYFNDVWIGATDDQGRIYADVKGEGMLRVIRHGFRDYAKSTNLGGKQTIIDLEQETAFLKVDSQPPGATVRLDGKIVGKTPLKSPVPVPAGFVKLEVEGSTGFKTFTQILELDEGTLDLTGVAAVKLERDLRGDASKLLAAGNVESAIAKLAEVGQEHSDYLLSRHELGEIYLTRLDQPADAAKAFGEVTANPSVAQYADKRFIGTHVNEGIALFMTAEKLSAEQPEVATAHYQKAIEVLDGVAPQLRFVPRDQYPQAVHNVDFYRALSNQRLWHTTNNPAFLSDAVRAWRSYLDGSAQAVPLEEGTNTYVANAEVYMKQAQASLTAVQKQTVNQ